ncbi:MAG TPA: Rne/Rng family ribonuclease [Candidatus Nanopelagicaceae bacterium]|nr:Rne/Rng family ribonuclease [Candidatus Nanopelagicaceae bacterium]
MAEEPKKVRKRAVKKSASKAVEQSESAPAAKEKKSKAGVIPAPIFQAAPVAAAPKAKPATTKPAAKSSAEVSGESEAERENRRRRRRRGGRSRRRLEKDESPTTSSELSQGPSSDSEGSVGFKKRRRRRRSGAEGVAPGEKIEEDGVLTVVKVREPRPVQEKPVREKKSFDRPPRRFKDRDRDRGRDKPRYNDYRENRRRGTILTDAEFLARRESVDREMLVRQQGDRTQIAILEDKVLVEHYVNRNSNISYVGNVYLGKVQNVLPSMEAAFVDIGKGRNAVLYAGEVNWDAAGLADNQERKIEKVLKTGQSVLVQVTKDPIGQKGARLTSQISLPGRYLVYVPGGGMSGISRRLADTERSRLKEILKGLITDEEGVIVRTAAEGASDEELTRDVIRLKAQWDDIKAKSENTSTSAPSLLYGEPDLTVRVIRDIFNEDFRKLTVQGSDAWDDINNYLGHIAPELLTKIEKYSQGNDLFAENRIDEQLAKALDRKVYLPSGGSLVIDRTEAMVVIDVNTGKFIGKGGNLEETVTKNNLEAAEEIARQLRLRDLGGIIVIDFIDMILESNREQVLRRLVECLGRDRTKHQVAEVTSLGLVQMTRKRVGQGLIEAFSTTCDSCGGRGIHVHMEPVNKKSLDREFVPAKVNKEENLSSDDSESDEKASLDENLTPAKKDGDSGQKKGFGRRKRRAASSGVVTA